MSLLIVDGYNIINSWPEFSDLRPEDMEIARFKLADFLEELIPFFWQKVILVYDAYRVKNKLYSYETDGGVEVVYTGQGQSADVFIERLVVRMTKDGEEVEVASSDSLEQRIVLWKGGRRLSARELRERLQECREVVRRGYLDLPSRNILDERLSQKVKAILEKWRRL